MKTLFHIKNLTAICLIILLLLGCKESSKHSGASGSDISIIDIKQSIPAPNFSLTAVDGNQYSLSEFRGKKVVLHIATTWCPYCNAEAPHLQSLAETNKEVQVVIIDVKESKELVEEKLVDQFGLTFPVLLDLDGSVAASFAPKEVLPELKRDEVMLASNIVIDREGNMRFMSLLDTKNFDSELIHIKEILDALP
ncbi:TlpA family protein disulfide reductase [Aegicerativicinus sediminis]|uniref:TlpA family protein disulfide reductase n=1 Tax=Aegicerativicinus sediminis TaxID=2893202 RepID=UPI001E4FA7C1|nr:TlpA disulfide reductase family protein [Aegicerativicinus sediminis]